jgi:hypothetical protein
LFLHTLFASYESDTSCIIYKNLYDPMP